MGSGGAVHSLGDSTLALGEGYLTDRRAIAFNDYLDHVATYGDMERLVSYLTLAPVAVHIMPDPDYFMPLLKSLGAAGPGAKGTRIRQSRWWENLGLGAYEFR
ncbi:MAG: hypothetical protein WCF90_03410 [Methanomicrobiales archaeon]